MAECYEIRALSGRIHMGADISQLMRRCSPGCLLSGGYRPEQQRERSSWLMLGGMVAMLAFLRVIIYFANPGCCL